PIANDHAAGLQCMTAVRPGNGFVCRNVGSRRNQRMRLSSYGAYARSAARVIDVGNAVTKATTARTSANFREDKTVRAALPHVTIRNQALAIPGSVNVGQIDQRRADDPRVRQLDPRAWPQTVLRTAWYVTATGAREAKRKFDVVVVVKIAKKDAVLL